MVKARLPALATVEDILALPDRRLEVVDGVLVEQLPTRTTPPQKLPWSVNCLGRSTGAQEKVVPAAGGS